MADKFNIEAKLKITGVDIKGDLNAGTLKFKVDTSALKKLVSDAGEAAKRVKAKFDSIKLKKLKVDINKTSLRNIASQIRKTIQQAVSSVKIQPITVKVSPQGMAGQVTRATQASQSLGATGPRSSSLTEQKKIAKSTNQFLRTDVKTAKEAQALQKRVLADKAKGLKLLQDESTARQKRLGVIRAEIAKEDKLKSGMHKKRLAEIWNGIIGAALPESTVAG